MNIIECPEKYKQYRLTMSNKSEYIVDGETKKNIVDSKGSWVELKDGSIINKSFIVEFKLDFNETKSVVFKNRLELSAGVVDEVMQLESPNSLLKGYKSMKEIKYE